MTKMISSALFALSIVFFAGCGGGGSGNSTVPSNPQPDNPSQPNIPGMPDTSGFSMYALQIQISHGIPSEYCAVDSSSSYADATGETNIVISIEPNDISCESYGLIEGTIQWGAYNQNMAVCIETDQLLGADTACVTYAESIIY